MGVMQVTDDLAGIYRLDCAKALPAGLLHDIARELKPKRQLALAEEAGIKFNHSCERLPIYLHGPIGAHLVRRELGITDPLISDAISTHTFYCKESNLDTPLIWCLRFADVLAPTKEWKGMMKLKKMVYSGQIEKSALFLSNWLIEYLEKQRIPVHPDIIKNFHKLSTMLDVDCNFFERR